MQIPAFAAALADEGHAGAREAKLRGRWNRPAANPEKNVTLVTCGFGGAKAGAGQAEAYAFQFAGPDGALSRAVHIPYRMTWNWNAKSWGWVPPTVELAARFAGNLATAKTNVRTPLALTVKPWQRRGEKDADQDRDLDETPALTGIDEMAALPWEKAHPILEVMSWWAAWENGLQPGRQDAPLKALVEVRMRFRKMDIRLHLQGGGKNRTISKLGVEEERCQASLIRMFLLAMGPPALRDFGQLAAGPAELLAADGKGVVFSASGVLTRRSPLADKRVYPPEVEEGSKAKPPRSACVYRQGQLLRYDRRIARVDPASGAERVLATRGAPAPWAFCPTGTKGAAVVSGGEIALLEGEKEVWKKTAPAPFTCGPVASGGLIIAGDAAGTLHAFQMADGAIRWQRNLPNAVHGGISVVGTPPQIYCCDRETLYALSPESGGLLWSRRLGDTLKAPAFDCGEGVLAAGKDNTLYRLAPHDGAVLARREWNTWLTHVTPLKVHEKRLLAVIDLDGRLSLLAPKSLQTLSSFSLGRPLAPAVLGVNAFPLAWTGSGGGKSGDDDLAFEDDSGDDRKPTILVADREGFVYLLNLPGEQP